MLALDEIRTVVSSESTAQGKYLFNLVILREQQCRAISIFATTIAPRRLQCILL